VGFEDIRIDALVGRKDLNDPHAAAMWDLNRSNVPAYSNRNFRIGRVSKPQMKLDGENKWQHWFDVKGIIFGYAVFNMVLLRTEVFLMGNIVAWGE